MSDKILIIDDEKGIRITFKEFLSKASYDVTTAEDFDSGMEYIRNERFDMIFVDILLGSHSGIDILEEVKRLGLSCPVIMITGSPNIETASAALRLGAFDYMAKPIFKDILLKIAEQALRHKSLIDENRRITEEKERYRKNLETIFKNLKDGIITVDRDMNVIETNAAVEAICGCSTKEVANKNFSEIATNCRGICQEVMGETLKYGKSIIDYRIECNQLQGPRRVVLLTSSPLLDQNEKFIGGILVIRDITQLTRLKNELKEKHKFYQLVGKSSRMQEVYKLIENLQETDTTVLITGESGTGKELVARALHYGSIRASKPLVTVNCSSLVENILESELFGHVKGAFTGAVQDKMGRFQMADGGTVFLDEIGDISPLIQLKLLRVLQERCFEKVGDSKTIQVDVRIIAATNQDLRGRVENGSFRGDLFYRLNVINLKLPPLRERRDDIPLLAYHFCQQFNEKLKKNMSGISDEAMALLMRYQWPGNVREIEHAIEHAFILCHDSRFIMDKHLPSEIRNYTEDETSDSAIRVKDESLKILRALHQTGWNKAKAARILGINRRSIYRKIARYNLTPQNNNGANNTEV